SEQRLYGFNGIMASPWGKICPSGWTRRQKEIGRRWRASPRNCPLSFHPQWLARALNRAIHTPDPAARDPFHVIAWQFWNGPSGEAALLRRLQARRCGETGRRLLKSAEIDHRVPLFRVWSEHRHLPWPKLLDFWGLPNLQAINRDVHAAKCANET